jgi:hypothetical protein
MHKNSESPGRSILLFAFLRDIKQRDRKAFVVITICMVVQLLLTFVKLEVTPFFLFGMYSEKMVATDTISPMKLLFNGQPLDQFNIPQREKDLLESTATNYIDIRLNNNTDVVRTRIETRYPLIYTSVLYPFFANRIYNTGVDIEGYKNWLRGKHREITGNDSGNIKIIKTAYLLNGNSLKPTVIANEILDVF